MPERHLIGWLSRLAASFDRHHIRYALAGGLALAVRAQARATVDIDLVIAADPAAVSAMRAAAASAGLLQTTSRAMPFRRVSIIRMLAPSDAAGEPIAIDYLSLPASLEADVLSRATTVRIATASVPVVSSEDLILLKLLRDSPQDRVDIATITRATPLDRAYLARKAKTLRILSRLHRALGTSSGRSRR